MTDFTVEGKIYRNGSFEQACLAIEKGKIVDIKKILRADTHLNVGANLILPAGIDLHVHFRDPGFLHKEDFSTGSAAAAFGGISCVFDMPNTKPQTISVQTLKEKMELASQKSVVDFGLYVAICDENLGSIAKLSRFCAGFKIFLGSSTQSLQLSPQNLKTALTEAHQAKKITLVHAENEQCLKAHQGKEQNLIDHVRCRPAECEKTAIEAILQQSQKLTSPIHICHLSSFEGLKVLQRKPANLSIGVTPHHLLFDVDTLSTKQAFYKVNPPIRSSFDRDALWSGINTALIDILESDHAPHTEDEKEVDFDSAPSGVPGVETLYPLFLAATKNKRLPLGTLLSMLCEKPARLLSLPKGKLEVGRDADFIIVDLKSTETVSAENLHSKCGWSPFEGFPAIFPTMVFIRGEKVISDHQLLVKKGFGTCIGG